MVFSRGLFKSIHEFLFLEKQSKQKISQSKSNLRENVLNATAVKTKLLLNAGAKIKNFRIRFTLINMNYPNSKNFTSVSVLLCNLSTSH